MNGSVKIWIFVVSVSILCYSCSETKSLAPDQYLFEGYKIKIEKSDSIGKKERAKLEDELEKLVRPTPNESMLGIKYKLLIYNFADTPTGKGLRYWLKNKVGEPPVIASMTTLEKSRAVMQNRLENRGFFADTVRLDTAFKGKKMTATFVAELGPQYKIRKVSYPSDTSTISQQIRMVTKRPLLKAGDPYDLDLIKEERNRIDTRLKQRGFYYFNPDYVLARVDSSVGKHYVDLDLIVKRSMPPKAKLQYYINNIVVFADYDIYGDTTANRENAQKLDGITIIDPDHKFKPELFPRTLVFKPGELYNRRDHDLSLNRLINLGTFKFVKVRFEEPDSLGGNKLNAFYYLTPTEKKSIRFQVSGLTKSNGSNGGQVNVTWRNRNIFRGAELFTVSVYGGIELQFLTENQRIRTNNAGISLDLYYPRLIPRLTAPPVGPFMPKTHISLGYDFYQRTTQYALNSVNTSFGYIWKETIEKEHQLNVLTISYVKPSQISPEFQQQLDTNLTLARSIEKQFIIGPNYNFNINTQLKNNRKANNFYFNANLDLSSNVLGWITGANLADSNQKLIFNTPFSQYIRGELDFRHYLSFSKNTTLVSRITSGLGYSYGNSLTMPYIKEFFAGGTNDLRAFRSRSLGPGSYYAGNSDTAFLPAQPGDIKLEMNAEFRFKLFSVFRWAFFVDAGNVWTLRTDSSRPGSLFTRNFLQQIAVGVGTGLRLDISILILRLDLGIPVREPWLPPKNRWVFDTNNMIWNFAIGYPF